MANDTSSETKSDVMAKGAFVRKLESKGCYAEIISQPVDIHAIIDGEDRHDHKYKKNVRDLMLHLLSELSENNSF